MASSFPGAIDSFTDPLSTSPLSSPSHALQHQNINDAVEKVEQYMGLVKVIPTSATGGTVSSSGTVTIGSAVSSVTVVNAFSALYDSYKIIVHGGAASGTTSVELTLGTSITGYYEARVGYRYDNAASVGAGATNATAWNIARSSTDVLSFQCELLGPFIAKPTTATWAYNDTRLIAGTSAFLGNGFHSVTTSYTDFKLNFPSATQTGGAIRIYGYRN